MRLAPIIAILVLLIHGDANGQALMLPQPAGFVRGVGECSEMGVGIASPAWRVRKGDEFEVRAVDASTTDGLRYSWQVTNGKIVSGQGTSKITIKAGSAKTPGFINITGLIEISVTARTLKPGSTHCSVEATHQIMVGRHREYNEFANVEDVLLDETRLVQPCPRGVAPQEGMTESKDSVISVTTIAKDLENDVLVFNYYVTAGIITKAGSKTDWDLTNVAPGSYSITVAVDDGHGSFGKSVTKTITVDECTGCAHVECPTITIDGPDAIRLGDEYTFVANVRGGSQSEITYAWTLTNGEIVGGQGSPSVTVKMPIDVNDKHSSVSVTIGRLGTCIDSVSKVFEDGRVKP